jgi:hypothetical protein
MTHLQEQNSSSDCLEHCRSCAESCLSILGHCLEKGGVHTDKKHIVLLQICADLCNVSARAMLLGSDHSSDICQTCAIICDACADSCQKLGEDEDMKSCAEICRSCAESCRAMTTEHTHSHAENQNIKLSEHAIA